MLNIKKMRGGEKIMPREKKKGPGRGWHGNSKAHAEAGRKGGKARQGKRE